MAQAGGVRRRSGAACTPRARVGAGSKWLVAFCVALAVFGAATGASAQQNPEERADCARRFEVAERTVAKDAYYAQAWTDSWIWTGTTFFVLNLTQAFMVGDYRRGEALTFAGTSLLLTIQRPLALTSDDALRGLRASAKEDPCLALADATSILKSNQVDGEMHRGWPIYVINVVFNLAVMGVLAAAVHEWDFAGHSDLGLQTLAGIALSTLQVYTYPQGSLRTSGTSLELTF
jgi:hypothetical protein